MLDRRWSAALAALVVASCGRAETPAPAASAPPTTGSAFTLTAAQRQRITLAPVVAAAFHRAVEATGTVTFDADRSTQVLSPISGPVSRLLVNLGAPVTAGQPLAEVSSPDFAAALGAYRKAEAAARNARRIADLDEKLFQNDALSRRDLEQAQTDAVEAESDRDAALQQLRSLGIDDARLEELRKGGTVGSSAAAVRAPIAGTVVEKLITPGQLLQAGTTPCFTVADLSTVWVMASVFEADLPAVTRGATARITTEAAPQPIQGKVDYIASLVDPNTRAVSVRIVAPNPGGALRKDAYVRVAIESAQEAHGLLIPVSAVLRDDQNLPFVYVQVGEGGFARRSIQLGPRSGSQQEVASGLRAGETVAVEGALFMQFAESQ